MKFVLRQSNLISADLIYSVILLDTQSKPELVFGFNFLITFKIEVSETEENRKIESHLFR